MNRDDVLAFASRDWAGVARAKQQYWVERYRTEGPAAARRAATQLLAHAERLGVAAGPEQRANDFAHHLRTRDCLDRAARALTGC